MLKPVVDEKVLAVENVVVPSVESEKDQKDAFTESEPEVIEESVLIEIESKKKPARGGRKTAASKPEPEPTFVEPRSARPKRGVQIDVVDMEEQLNNLLPTADDLKTPLKKSKGKKNVDFNETPEVKEPTPAKPKAARGGRAASKAAQEKIASDIADMSNLGKKKRRPDGKEDLEETTSEPEVVEESKTVEEPKKRGGKRKPSEPELSDVPEIVEEPKKRGGKRKAAEPEPSTVSPPKRASRSRR